MLVSFPVELRPWHTLTAPGFSVGSGSTDDDDGDQRRTQRAHGAVGGRGPLGLHRGLQAPVAADSSSLHQPAATRSRRLGRCAAGDAEGPGESVRLRPTSTSLTLGAGLGGLGVSNDSAPTWPASRGPAGDGRRYRGSGHRRRARRSSADPSRHQRPWRTIRNGSGDVDRNLLGGGRLDLRSNSTKATGTRPRSTARCIQEALWNRRLT